MGCVMRNIIVHVLCVHVCKHVLISTYMYVLTSSLPYAYLKLLHVHVHALIHVCPILIVKASGVCIFAACTLHFHNNTGVSL